jgi:dinuclear metal center YbgI/SA1388 family protein
LKLRRVVRFLGETLDIQKYKGDSSLNGLQVEGRKEVGKIVTAVDACRESISGAVRLKADMLIVHHGLFWGEAEPITGILARRVGMLLRSGVSLYAAHLPLDCHPEIGNNVQIAESLGIIKRSTFGLYKGNEIGVGGKLPRPVGIRGLAARVRRIFGAPVQTFAFGPGTIKRLGIVSGGGSMLTQAAAEAGYDALLTGESSHSVYHTARECRINMLYAGHYSTETVGVRALGDLISKKLGIKTVFIDIPTGL